MKLFNVSLPAGVVEKLRPHQIPATQHLLQVLKAKGYALCGDDTGVGKTYEAAAIATALNVPTLAVVPKISVTAWHRVADYLGTSFSVINPEMLRTGRTLYGWWDNTPPAGFECESRLKCVWCMCWVDLDNPQPCHANHTGIHCAEWIKKPWKYGHFHWHPNIKFLIVDEAHRFGGLDSLNSEMLIAAKRDRIPALALTATPAVTPLNLRALGYLLGLHTLVGDETGFYAWARKHGCRRDMKWGGWKFFGSREAQMANMLELHSEIFPACGSRIRTKDIPGFPDRTIAAELYDIKESGRIDELYREMRAAIDALHAMKLDDKAPDHPLTKILRARQEIELLKVPIVVELVRDYLAKGLSVAVFINFEATMKELRRRLQCNCYIDGTQTGAPAKRQKCIDDFEDDRERVILVNNDAGGVSVSLHDVRGEFPRVGLVMPAPSAVKMRQVFGRLPREGGRSPALYRVLFVAGTVEMPLQRSLAGKLDNLDALTDADWDPMNLRINGQPTLQAA